MAPDAKQARAAEVLALAKRLEVGRQGGLVRLARGDRAQLPDHD
jgi:hypothetical protein